MTRLCQLAEGSSQHAHPAAPEFEQQGQVEKAAAGHLLPKEEPCGIRRRRTRLALNAGSHIGGPELWLWRRTGYSARASATVLSCSSVTEQHLSDGVADAFSLSRRRDTRERLRGG